MSQHDVEVSKLERDLRFFPVASRKPKRLTAEQIAAYNENGYLSGLRVLDAAQARRARERSDALLERFIREGKGSYAIDRFQDRFATIWDLATTPSILDVVEDLLGPNLICWATHYFCKLPGDPKAVAWHQDCSYWPLTPSKNGHGLAGNRRRGPGKTVACASFHALIFNGHLRFRESDPDEQNILSQTIEGAERFGAPADIELKAGENLAPLGPPDPWFIGQTYPTAGAAD